MQETMCMHVIVPTGNAMEGMLHKVAQGPDVESGSEEAWQRPEGAAIDPSLEQIMSLVKP